MILGLSVPAFTLLHVAISLVGIASGLVVLGELLRSKPQGAAAAIFLAATILTSVTGFFFPAERVLPSHVVGIVSLVALAAAVLALYEFRAAGAWRWIYAAAAVLALYLNVFVLVVQGFLKVPALHALAPTQGDPAFIVVQVLVLALFLWAGIRAARGFRPARA